ncbi:MAG: DUF4372 domain-containing protein [Prevotella sp.]|nr:DUF4372 domain-containing protein [Prevotella sp.]
MGKGTNFIGQPLLTQLLKSLDRDKILRMSRKMGAERYVKTFDGWEHLVCSHQNWNWFSDRGGLESRLTPSDRI